ncbi:MAG TPA: dockerin type I repeat-containing protein [Methanocorpusculum sp.]|nr:dockerin type I repeat-containing protein [Methanocorpusculum sp.]
MNSVVKLLIMLMTAGFVILCTAGAVSALDVTIEMPNQILAGETVTGYIYINDAGADNSVQSYQMSLKTIPADAGITFKVNKTGYLLDLGDGMMQSPDNVVASGASLTPLSYEEIDAVQQLVCEFAFTAPENPQAKSYEVTLNLDDRSSYLWTEGKYFYDGSDYNYAGTIIPGSKLNVKSQLVGITSVPKINVEIDLPDEAQPGETLNGHVYITNADLNNSLVAYQLSLISDAAAGDGLQISVVNDDDVLQLGTAAPTINGAVVADSVANPLSESTEIDADKQLVCNISVKIPDVLQGTPQKTSYTIYVDRTDRSSFILTPDYSICDNTEYRLGDKVFTGAYLNATPVTITVADATIELVANNGWYTGKDGNNLQKEGVNITDPVTGVELCTVTPDAQRFNASTKAELKYKVSASGSDNGVIELFTAKPLLYSISGKSLEMSASTVQAFDADDNKVGTAGTGGFDESGVYSHTCVIPEDASYLTVTFTGRVLGDVDNNKRLSINDCSFIQKSLLGVMTFSIDDEFYGDVDANTRLSINDCSAIQKYLLGVSTYNWM